MSPEIVGKHPAIVRLQEQHRAMKETQESQEKQIQAVGKKLDKLQNWIMGTLATGVFTLLVELFRGKLPH